MSRKLCSLCLAAAVFISTLSIAYADDMARVEVTEGDYALAVAALADAGLDTGFVSGRASTQRLYESGLPAGGQDASLNELQFLALDEMEAEALSRQAQREQLAANLALLDQYDGVKLASSATVYSDAGSTDSGHTSAQEAIGVVHNGAAQIAAAGYHPGAEGHGVRGLGPGIDSSLGHVGVYIGGGQFIHASDSGVVVASLYSSYWAGNYYGAGRILVD